MCTKQKENENNIKIMRSKSKPQRYKHTVTNQVRDYKLAKTH